MGTMAFQITSLIIVYSTVYSGADQSKHQRSVSLAFVRGIHRGPVNSPHKWSVTRKMFPNDCHSRMRGSSYVGCDITCEEDTVFPNINAFLSLASEHSSLQVSSGEYGLNSCSVSWQQMTCQRNCTTVLQCWFRLIFLPVFVCMWWGSYLHRRHYLRLSWQMIVCISLCQMLDPMSHGTFHVISKLFKETYFLFQNTKQSWNFLLRIIAILFIMAVANNNTSPIDAYIYVYVYIYMCVCMHMYIYNIY